MTILNADVTHVEECPQEFRTVSKRRRVIFSNKCPIYQSSQPEKNVFWSKENPYYCEEVECHPLHAMVWVAMNS